MSATEQSPLPPYAHTDAKILLTSAGITRTRLRHAAYEMLGIDDTAPLADTHIGIITTYGQSPSQRIWTNHWLRNTFGRRAVIDRISVGRPDPQLDARLWANDLLVLPSGNALIAAAGLQPDNPAREVLIRRIQGGTPVISEGAGSILLGASLGPASIPPADYRPPRLRRANLQSLEVVSADVIVHAPPPPLCERYTMLPGVIGAIGNYALSHTTLSPNDVEAYCKARLPPAASHPPIDLTDIMGAIIADGTMTYINKAV
jgi:hypothetical protein